MHLHEIFDLVSGKSLIDAAEIYLQEGLCITPCEERGKTSVYKSPLGLTLNAITTAFWTTSPRYNIGLLTGGRNGLWVLDVDGAQGYKSYDWLLQALGEEELDTTRVTTGRGFHLYFGLSGHYIIPSSIGILPGIDIRGDESHVVAPPSVHEQGHTYKRFLNLLSCSAGGENRRGLRISTKLEALAANATPTHSLELAQTGGYPPKQTGALVI